MDLMRADTKLPASTGRYKWYAALIKAGFLEQLCPAFLPIMIIFWLLCKNLKALVTTETY